MTDKDTDIGKADATAASEAETTVKPPQKPAVVPTPEPPAAPPPKSGRGLAALALLVGLGAGGGSGYLWYLWQQDQAQRTNSLNQAIQQAIGQIKPDALKKDMETLQRNVDQRLTEVKKQSQEAVNALRSQDQDISSKLLGLTGNLQPIQNAMELQKGETKVVKTELGLLRDGHGTLKALTRKQQEILDTEIKKRQEQLAKLRERIRNLQLSYKGLEDHLETVKLIATKGGDVNAFLLAETTYLLRLADTKLSIEQDVASARKALIAARERLGAVNEKGLDQTQAMLDEAIASLRGVELPDISGLAHKLVEMNREIDSLPLKINTPVPDIKNRLKPASTINMSDNTGHPWWERAGEAVWNQFRDIVIIRHETTKAPALIPVKNEFLLRQNTRLVLESMRMALLRGDSQSFQDSYTLLRDWVTTYFDTDDSRVKQFLADSKALQTVQFNPYIPGLKGLNLAFHDFMNQRQPLRSIQKTPTPSTETRPATGDESAAPAEETTP